MALGSGSCQCLLVWCAPDSTYKHVLAFARGQRFMQNSGQDFYFKNKTQVFLKTLAYMLTSLGQDGGLDL